MINFSPLFTLQVNNGDWNLGDELCDTWVAMDVMCCTASILNLTAISVDRWELFIISMCKNLSMGSKTESESH